MTAGLAPGVVSWGTWRAASGLPPATPLRSARAREKVRPGLVALVQDGGVVPVILAHEEHRSVGDAHDLVRDAADDGPARADQGVGAHHDQVGPDLAGLRRNRLGDRADRRAPASG